MSLKKTTRHLEIPIGLESDLTPEEREELKRDIRTSESSSLDGAVDQGERLLRLNPKPSEMTPQEIGMGPATAYAKMRLYRESRDPESKMNDPRWNLPSMWAPCSMIIEATNKKPDLFEAMLASSSVNHKLVSEDQIKRFIRSFNITKFISEQKEQPKVRLATNQECALFNVVTCGDALTLTERIPDSSVDLLLTSPPYVEQRKLFYPGIKAEVYPDWFLRFMSAVWPKLKKGGSALFVMRANIDGGRVLPWLIDTRYKMAHESEWIEPGEMVWLKPDRGNQGSHYVLRPNWENILWFGKSGERQFIDRAACGKWSENIGYVSTNRFGLDGGVSEKTEGIANHPDVFVAMMGEMDKGLEAKYGADHPAMFPPTLVDKLIRTFCLPGGLCFDPFAGSGTTCLVAKKLNHPFIGFDVKQLYVDLANARLATEYKYEPDNIVIRGLFEDEE